METVTGSTEEGIIHGLPTDIVWEERPCRLPDIDPAAFSAEQRRSIEESNRVFNLKGVAGPFRMWIRNPAINDAMKALIAAETECKFISARLNRLTGSIIASQWKAQFEWFAQSALAAHEGVSPEVLESIRLGQIPKFTAEDERVVYDLLTELNDSKEISPKTFAQARIILGDDGVAELICNASVFVAVGLVIKAVDIKAPSPFPADPVP